MNNRQQPNEERELEHILKAGLEPLEEEMEIDVPSQEWFEQFVLQEQKNIKEGLKRDIILFGLIAGCLLLILSLTLVKSPATFLLLQVAVFIGAVIFSSFTFYKQVRKT
ncbi:YxlC family protein [Rossellomorea aquimaris]|uniref:YxlC family protein n=1 Tax=Rossellomorea aquimaris TaxID=189382 RepID=UPI001CD449EA|nr:YxlC family protein [Rossellomorea aquimaris]MCA1056517.1 YxlC family protein [Rossellomorea aquimaris]